MNFQNYTNWSDLVIPPSVESKMKNLNLRVKDILWTLNFPMKQQSFPGEKKYKRTRWFGGYWTGLYCKWDEYRQKWVILTCWKEDVLTIS